MPGEDQLRNAQQIEMGLARMDALKGQIENLRVQRETLAAVANDYDSSIEVLKALGEGGAEETLVPVGGLVYIKARIADREGCLLNEGAGVFIRKDVGSAIERIKQRRTSLDDAIKRMAAQMEELLNAYNSLASQTQGLYEKQMLAGQGPEGSF